MKDRYIRRFVLPRRLYAAASPVVLAAGVLLEDTQTPRLVAQLKWTSVDPRTISALTVAVRCPKRAGETVFTYAPLRVSRGWSFGQYTAVVLPEDSGWEMEVRAVSARFADGTAWTAPEGADWSPLPAFVPLEQAVEDPGLLTLSRGLPKGRYGYWSGQALWYCPCGGVNRDREERCHRCGCRRELARHLATPDGLSQLRQARQEEQERLAREQEEARARAEARKEAARQRLAGLGAWAHREKPADSGTLEEAAVQPSPGVQTAGKKETARQGKSRRGRLLAGAAALVAVGVLGGAFLLPRLAGAGTQGAAAQGAGGVLSGILPSKELHVTAPGDGETVAFDVTADEEGVCIITPELVQAQFPEVMCISLSGEPDMGEDIDPYLIDSFHMAMLVTSEGREGALGEWGSFDTAGGGPSRNQCLLLFDRNTHLMGHSVGMPREVEDGVWRLEITLCDYEFTALYEEQRALFEEQWRETFDCYLSPEEMADAGAAWFLTGYNTGRGGRLMEGDAQIYHLWSQFVSPYREEQCRAMDQLNDRLPRGDRWRCFLLLDKDYELVGYTVLDSSGRGAAQTAGDTRLVPAGTVDLILEENDRGQCEFTEEQMRQAVPETAFFNVEGYAPDLDGDVEAYVKDSFHMAWLVSSRGQQWGGHSSAIYSLSEDNLFVLLLFEDFTTLRGYFVGSPEDLGGGRWRMEITLCNYDFTALYEQQAQGYTDAPQLPQAPLSVLESGEAVWYIDPESQFAAGEEFGRRMCLQRLWSRAASPYISRFCRPITDLTGAARLASPERPKVFLLLDRSMQYLGWVEITDGEWVSGLNLSFPSGLSA